MTAVKPSDADRNVLLARIRVAGCQARLIAADIEEVGMLLSADLISVSGALYWLRANGVLHLCLTADEVEEAATRPDSNTPAHSAKRNRGSVKSSTSKQRKLT